MKPEKSFNAEDSLKEKKELSHGGLFFVSEDGKTFNSPDRKAAVKLAQINFGGRSPHPF